MHNVKITQGTGTKSKQRFSETNKKNVREHKDWIVEKWKQWKSCVMSPDLLCFRVIGSSE